MDWLHHTEAIHLATKQKGGQIQTYKNATLRGTDVSLVVTSAPKDLHGAETMYTVNTVAMPRRPSPATCSRRESAVT